MKKILDPTGKKPLRYQVDQVTTSDGTPFPLLNVSAFATSAKQAVVLANRVANALQRYVANNQTAGNVPEATRVSLPAVNRAERAKVFEGVKFTAPLMLFVLAMALTTFIAFVRHNVQLGRARNSRIRRRCFSRSRLPGQRSTAPLATRRLHRM